jgi:arsenical pump membrane protein
VPGVTAFPPEAITVAGDLVPLLALVALLGVAFTHPSGRVEAGVALTAAVCCVLTASSTWADAAHAVRRLLPVVVFLAAILVVAGACAELGLFRAIGERIGRPGTSGQRFLGLTFVAAVAVTAVLSLDATVVLLSLVVLAAAGRAGVRPGPALSACVRLANSSSLLLPVSNLTTLLALHSLDLSFGRFALVMAPAWLAVVAVEYAGHRLFYARVLRGAPVPTPADTRPRPMPRFPLVVVGLMLAGFAATSVVGIGAAWGAAWVAVATALVLTVHAVATGRGARGAALRRAVHSAHLGFATFVLGLGVVVDALTRGGLGDLVGRSLPDGSGLVDLLLLALVATTLANLLNNLPATLLLVPLVAPLGTVAVLATLVGLNVGSSLTWTGSLANLLWRRTLSRAGVPPSGRDFHAIALLTVPMGVVVGVVAVWAWAGVVL